MKRFFLILILVSCNIFAQQKHEYIQKNAPIANELSEKYGIPSSIILAIAFVETGGGTSKGAKILNNHFGIVGENNVNNSKYRSFSATKESYEVFCKLIEKKKYYTTLKNNKDPKAWIEAIAAAGYSTRPAEWKRRIDLIISKFELHK